MPFVNGHALLVGVGTYQDPRFSVPITLQDATALAGVLQDPQAAGYPAGQVTLLTGPAAARAGVLRALADLQAAATPESTVLLFLCGHGTPAPGGGYYFLSSDAQRGLDGEFRPETVVSSVELVRAIGAVQAQKVLVLFNTCFAGLVAGSLDPADLAAPLPSVSPPDAVVNAVLGAGEGRVVITACRKDQKSNFAGDANHTLFTAALLAALGGAAASNGQGAIGVFELYDYVYDQVHNGIKRIAPDRGQDPVISIREAVGPFPVALYRGGVPAAHFAGALDAAAPPLQDQPHGAVQVVTAAAAVRAYQQVVVSGAGAVSVGGNLTDSPVITGSNNRVQQNRYDGDYVGGDKVGGDKIRGDKLTVGNVSGTGIAIGRGAHASVTQGGAGGDAIASAFAPVFAAIDARPARPADAFDNDGIRAAVLKLQTSAAAVQQAAAGGEAGADTSGLEQLLRQVGAVAPDIADVIMSALVSPTAGIAPVISKVVQKARNQSAGGSPPP